MRLFVPLLALLAASCGLEPARAQNYGQNLLPNGMTNRGAPAGTDVIPCQPSGANVEGCTLSAIGAYVEQSVVTYGADPTGAADSTAAFQAAAAASPQIVVPPGTYLINGAVTLSQTGCHVHFSGQAAVTINVGSATGDVFLVTGAKCTLDGGVSFSHQVTRTAGADIHCSAEYCHVGPIYDNAPYWAVEIDGSAALAYIDHPSCRNITPNATAAGSACVRVGVTASNESSIIVSPFDDIDATASASTVPTAGVLVDFSDALQILNPNLLHDEYGVCLCAGNGQNILATQITAGGYLDTPLNYALALITTGTGNIIHTTVNGVGLSDAATMGQSSAAGILLSQSGSGTLAGFTCVGCDLFLDGPAGVNMVGYIEDVSFVGGCIAGVTDGVATNATVTGLSLAAGLRIGSCNGFSGVTTGVHFYGSTSGVDVSHVRFTGTTTPIGGLTNLAGGANRIQDNPGYNPVGGGAVTVGASPFTYQNGPTPAVVYISGGTVSNIFTGGIAAPYNSSGSTYVLAPNQSIQIVYTAAPAVEQVTQ